MRVFTDIPETFNILPYLRATVAASGLRPVISLRASIGIGEISVTGKSSPHEEDGEAFALSRQGLEQLGEGRHTRRTKIITGRPELDRTIDVLLLLLDQLAELVAQAARP